MEHSADEMMTVAAARELRDGEVCFVGIGLPSTAANLARGRHAPDVVLIYESGTIGSKPTRLPLSIGDGDLAETADSVVPVPEIFNYWLQGGRIDVGFLGAAQIDRRGNLNSTVIGSYDAPKVRLPGAGGAPEIAALTKRVITIIRQSERTFVDELDFKTSLGADDQVVITDLGVLRRVDGELVLTALHPGVTLEQAREATGWELAVADDARDDRAADRGRAGGAAGAQACLRCYILDAVRTPVGKLGGALAAVRPDDLAATVVQALVERNPGVEPDEVYFGDANQAGEDNRNVARMAVLLAGLPTSVPGATVNRLCGSGMEAAFSASRAIAAGDETVLHRRRRRVDEPRAVGGAQARQAVPAHERDDALDHARLAHGQPRRCRTSGRSRSARAPRSSPTATGSPASSRTSSRCDSHQQAAAAWDRGAFADEVVAVRRRARARREHPRRHDASRSWRSSSRCSARTARSRRATRRR